jgi:hypothetical protein
MRVSSILGIALLATGALSTVPADAATPHRNRYRGPVRTPFVVQVPPRSFLDPGPIVPVGSLSNYVYASQYPLTGPYSPYSYINHFGRPPLPEGGGYVLFDHLDFGPLSGD